MLIAIVGAGTMGGDIAQAAALGQNETILYDVDSTILRRTLARISRSMDRRVQQGTVDLALARRAKRLFRLTTELEQCAAADVVIEAITDTLELKRALFASLDAVTRPDTLLATTTNTLSITALAAGARLPDRVVGLHFFPPAHTIKLVEVICSPHTRPEIANLALDVVRRMDKTPVQVDDTPGWIVNRIAQAYFGEALHLLDNGLEAETVDRLLEAAGFPMGPFRLMDFVGVDRALDVTRTIFEATYHDARYRPHPRHQRLVEAGYMGRKTGRGFHTTQGGG